MKNQTINLKNLCSGIGFFSLFLIFSGSELKAESLKVSEKTYMSPKKIKWVRYKESNEDK